MERTYIDEVVEKLQQKINFKNEELLHMYALLVLVKGEDTTARDVHDCWAVNMNFRPVTDNCYGHEHGSIVPFEQLSEEVRNKDNKYVDAVRAAAAELKCGS